MSSPDYHVHLDRDRYDSLWENDGSESFPFGEDDEDLDRIIREEVWQPRKTKRRRRKT